MNRIIDRAPDATTEPPVLLVEQRVTIVGVDMSIRELSGLLLKLALASIPAQVAMLMIVVLGWVAFLLAVTLFRPLG